MLTYAAIVPHPPSAIQNVGKEHIKKLQNTIDAFTHIGEELLSLHIDTVLLITPFGERYKNALGIALHDPYTGSLTEFGDMSTSISMQPDMKLIDKLQRIIRKEGGRSTMTTNNELDHGSTIPLILMERFLENIKLAVITPPVDTPKAIVELGHTVREAINHSEQRVAVICSAELSNRLSELSPGGVHVHAEDFDNKIRTSLVDGNIVPILKVTEQEVNEQGAEGLDAIRLLWGVLGDTRHTMRELSYEHPFGIGHLVMVAKLQ